MDDDHRADGIPAEEDEKVATVHDDIVQRLLEYQRQLREGATGGVPATTATAVAVEAPPHQIVDLTEAEADSSDAGPGSTPTPAWAQPSAAETRPSRDGADEVVDVAAAEASAKTSRSEDADVIVLRPNSTSDVSLAADAERVARVERSLETLAARFADLRSSFHDMAIAADERLTEIERLLTDLRAEH